jgi:membrane glycosyltransferase
VLRVFCGIDGGWRPQRCQEVERSWLTYFRFHAVETALGLALVTGIITGLLSLWLWPLAASLFLAALISRWTSASMAKQSGLLATPEDIVEPAIVAQSLTNSQRIAEAAEAAAAPLELLEAAE